MSTQDSLALNNNPFDENKLIYKDEEMLTLVYDQGIKVLTDTVKSTLGPYGRSILIVNYGGNTFIPVNTKDGQTVASSMYAENWVSNGAMNLAKDAAQKTDARAGDGTTTCLVFLERATRDIVTLIREHLRTGNPLDRYQIKLGMEDVIRELFEWVPKNSLKVDIDSKEAYQVALCASNGDDKIAKICVDFVKYVGLSGYPEVVPDPRAMEPALERIEGEHEFEIPIAGAEFIPANERGAIAKNPLVIVSNLSFESGLTDFANKAITDPDYSTFRLQPSHLDYTPAEAEKAEMMKKFHPTAYRILEAMTQGRQIVLIGNSFSDIFMNVFIRRMVQLRPGMPTPIIPVKVPAMTTKQELADLALLLGTEFIENSNRHLLYDMSIDNPKKGAIKFGTAKSIFMNMNTMIVKDPYGDKEKIEKRIKAFDKKIHKEINDTSEATIEYRKYVNRMRGITAKVVIDGAVTAVITEKIFRVIDALNSLRSAMQAGVVPGGGYALWKAADEISKTKIKGKSEAYLLGRNIAINTLREPYRVIKSNSLFEKTVNENPDVTPYEGVWDSATTYSVAFQYGIEGAVSAVLLVSAIMQGVAKVVDSSYQQ